WGVLPAIAGAALQELVDLAAILTALRAVRPGPTEHQLSEELRRGVELTGPDDLAMPKATRPPTPVR
ncbi:MAG TPA: hypothetical protein VLS51_08930, partial [Propionibacteriaceae bacterium]|nr:hypothetical protein [Propionibacteriaceae bacterium]